MGARGRTAGEIRDANTRYHDAAAGAYDAKWGIGFGANGQAQVCGKLRKALGRQPGRYERSLEIGAGTGYFSLNLLRAGVVREAVCTDISSGMLERLTDNAAELGLAPQTVVCHAEQLPFADGRFDLVLGHAVLHHLPDLRRAFAEFHRVLQPGGALVFAGEPSRHGDRLATLPKRAARLGAPLWRRALRAGPRRHPHGNGDPRGGDHGLEWEVDVHAFTPGELAELARNAGFERVRVSGEELLASWFGWTNRALEATAEPADIPQAWIQYAYRGYLALQQVDSHLLESRLPAALFYNLLLSARRAA